MAKHRSLMPAQGLYLWEEAAIEWVKFCTSVSIAGWQFWYGNLPMAGPWEFSATQIY